MSPAARIIPLLLLFPSRAFGEDPPPQGGGSDPAPSGEDSGSETPAPEAPKGESPAPAPAEAPKGSDPAPTSTEVPKPAEPAPTATPLAAPAAPSPFLFTPKPGAPPFKVDISGAYSLWILNQHGFLLGNAANPLDDSDYVVQMLRVGIKAGVPAFGVVARLDAGQGWWGVDNEPDVDTGIATDADGNVNALASYNPYKMFGNKDTNYTVHFDHVYAYIAPPLPFELRAQIGRQYLGAGHKLVLDEDVDGVQLFVNPSDRFGFTLSYALVSEGVGSYRTPVGNLMADQNPWNDAHLLGGNVLGKLGPVAVGGFGYYYFDRSDLDTATGDQKSTFLPQGQGAFASRFRPNVSQLGAFGLTVDGDIKVLDGLKFEFEFDGLVGRDNVENADYAGGTLDRNDGNIRGWNLYAKVDQGFAPGPVKLKVGATLGLGSGDEDHSAGPGNVNKIQTMGFFPFTNVWEDSVMPDIEGISPQGLGSPVSRGYREFENTVAVQGRFGFTPAPPLSFDASYTFLRAMVPIHGFDATGTPTAETSQDIGHEVDVDFTLRILPKVTAKAQFGVFFPGEGAALLINGNTDAMANAWELKQSFEVGF